MAPSGSELSQESSQVLVLGQICLLPVVLPGVPGCEGGGGGVMCRDREGKLF